MIGIVPGTEPDAGESDCTHVVATGIGHARNLAVVSSGDAVIAIGGEWGTLSEIAFARELGRPVVALSSWKVSGGGRWRAAPGSRSPPAPPRRWSWPSRGRAKETDRPAGHAATATRR